jgi:cytochrome c oxidase subunit II
MRGIRLARGLLGLAGSLAAGAAHAAEPTGQPMPWELYYQRAVSPIMERVTDLHNLLLVIITLITLFVLGLLAICIFRFNSKANPTPSKTTHNTLLEIAWTTLPVIILVIIAVPSFKLIYYYDRIPDAEMTIKATGNQWYWSYEYPDHGGFSFDSNMLKDGERKPDQPRLLAVDNPIVIPVNTTVRVLTTAADVIHAFALPSAGVKIDAVPGRINETWMRIEEVGSYYGMCSELCGQLHAFMPIQVNVVSKEEFEAWAKQKQAELGDRDAGRKLAARAAQ